MTLAEKHKIKAEEKKLEKEGSSCGVPLKPD